MRYKFVPVVIAAAAPLLALSAPAAHAASAVRAAPAVPAIQYCASGEPQVQIDDTNPPGGGGYVVQWYAPANKFTTEPSGHTIFCQKNKQTINGIPYYEFAAVLNGSESNDCMSTGNPPRAKGSYIGLNGCQAGKNYLLFAPIIGTGSFAGFYWLVTDAEDSCGEFIGGGVSFDQDGTSTNGGDCGSSLFDKQSYDWQILLG